MLNKLINLGRKIFKKKSVETVNADTKNTSPLTSSLKRNIDDLKHMVGLSGDVVVRRFKVSGDKNTDAAVVYVDGLADKDRILYSIMNTLALNTQLPGLSDGLTKENLENAILEKGFVSSEVKHAVDWVSIIDGIFSGDTVLLVDGIKGAFIIETRKWVDRGVQENTSEQVVRGPRDSFSETLRLNTMLLRRRIKSPKLQLESMKVGSLTKTDIVIAYIKGIVNPKLVEEIRSRINRIETDSILETNMLEEFIEDSPWSIIPQIRNTERPDKTAAHLLEGGAAIIVDGTPVVLLLPTTFWQFLHSPDDHYERVYTTFLLRALRLLALVTALTLPSFYIAITSYHHEMIPQGVLEVIIASRRGVPFPVLVEAFIMEFILEIIREAGVRLPRNVGQAISIVGALVLGQAAIQSKLASPITVTVVSLTAVSNFAIPSFSAALTIRFMRFGLMIVSGTFGIFGFISVIFVIMVHLCSLRSFGVPFLAPLTPLIPADLRDSQVRLPMWLLSRRPKTFGPKDQTRQKSGLKPGPYQKDGQPKGEDKDA
ncbi:MAG: Nutrient germinant receptor inner membrane subunit A (GerKA/GerAA/GerBA) [Firmicutes bacterium]|nr:Nutrient germinant receptor inner membrane subunit A (GerKA/GerAA/GerBA) [Bacillota bacterium]